MARDRPVGITRMRGGASRRPVGILRVGPRSVSISNAPIPPHYSFKCHGPVPFKHYIGEMENVRVLENGLHICLSMPPIFLPG